MINDYFQNKKKMMTLNLKEAEGYPCVLTKSAGKNLKDYKIYGNSEQDGTPTPTNPIEVLSLGENSKNLFNPYDVVLPLNVTMQIVGNDVLFTHDGLSSATRGITYDITLPAGTYTVNKTDNTIINVGTNGGGKAPLTVPRTFELSNTTTINFTWFIGSGTIKTISNFQIEEGTTATEYRPYKYIDVLSSGKNLFNINIHLGVDNVTIPTNITKDITVSAVNNDVVLSEIVWRMRVKYLDGTYQYVADVGHTAHYNFPRTFTATKQNPIVEILYRDTRMVSGSYDIQVEYGDVVTQYEPYQAPITTTIDLSGHEPLRKIGDVADYIDYKNKKIVRNIAELVVTGNEDSWEEVVQGTPNNVYRFTVANSNIINRAEGGLITHFQFEAVPVSTTKINIADIYYSTTLYKTYFRCRPDLTLYPTLQSFKTFLQEQYANGTPVKVYYGLATPIEEPFDNITIPTLKKTCTITSHDEEIESSNIWAKYFKK